MSDEAKSNLLRDLANYNIKYKVESLNEFVHLLSSNENQLREISQELIKCNNLLSECKLIALAVGIAGALGLVTPHIVSFLRAKQEAQSLHQFLGLTEFEQLKQVLRQKLDAIKCTQQEFMGRVNSNPEALDENGRPIAAAFLEQAQAHYAAVYSVVEQLESFRNHLFARAGDRDAKNLALLLTNVFSIFQNTKIEIEELTKAFSETPLQAIKEAGKQLPDLQKLCHEITINANPFAEIREVLERSTQNPAPLDIIQNMSALGGKFQPALPSVPEDAPAGSMTVGAFFNQVRAYGNARDEQTLSKMITSLEKAIRSSRKDLPGSSENGSFGTASRELSVEGVDFKERPALSQSGFFEASRAADIISHTLS